MGQDLDKYKDEDSRHTPLFPLPRKESNYLTDLGEGIRNLDHLVYIPKFDSSDNC